MGTVVVLAIVAVVAFFAFRSSTKHLKGQGGCCGGGDAPKAEHKALEHPVICEKMVHIEGMHCANCKARVEWGINRIEGASCTVNLKKKIATVRLDRPVSDEELRRAVVRLDYDVIGIETVEI